MDFLTVVMYHYVRPLNKTRFPLINGLDLDHFINQINFLFHNYNFVSMEDVISSFDGKITLPSKPVLLTFDDGYIDHYLSLIHI